MFAIPIDASLNIKVFVKYQAISDNIWRNCHIAVDHELTNNDCATLCCAIMANCLILVYKTC